MTLGRMLALVEPRASILYSIEERALLNATVLIFEAKEGVELEVSHQTRRRRSSNILMSKV